MQEKDRQHVGEVLRELTTVHRVPFNTNVVKAYWAALQDMSREEFDRAVAHLRRHAMWMPKPAEFYASTKQGWI